MPPFTKAIVRCLWIAASIALLPPNAIAAPDGFYKGKSITFIIGSAAGGGYDTYSRLLASHIGQHLEGQPSVVAQNMPGAGSIRAANYLYNVARKDGTTIGMLDEAIYLNQILGTPELKIDATKFNWIGRILANSAVLFARRARSGGEDRRRLRQGADRFHIGDGVQTELDGLEEHARHEVHDHIGLSGKQRRSAGHDTRRGGRVEHAMVALADQGRAQHPRRRDPPPAADRASKRRRTCRTFPA